MSAMRQRRRRQIKALNGSIALRAKTKGSPCKHGEGSPKYYMEEHPWLKLPKDLWWHIHSLMPTRDATRVACLSQDFVHSWRYHPNLTFNEKTLGLNGKLYQNNDKMRHFTNRVDKIMKKHSGIGVKTFKLELGGGTVYDRKDSCHLDHLGSWLQVAVKPGIEEVTLALSPVNKNYDFPCSLFSGGTGDSLRCLELVACNFHPTVGSCCLRSLTRLMLCVVHILEDNLRCIFSTACALEQLELVRCNSIICLRVPCLQQLNHLRVSSCTKLQLIESKAPNLSSFSFTDGCRVQLSLGDTLRIKNLTRSCFGAAFYARTELPSYMPNLETLTIFSDCERFNAPMMPSRFLHLKFLSITMFGMVYDFFSLVSFIYASPSLETFVLCVFGGTVGRTSIFTNPSDLRTLHDHHHDKLKRVQMTNFSAIKSLVELTCQILQSATSLERLTLDPSGGAPRCSVSESGKCMLMSGEKLLEARRAVLAAQTYIKPKAPSTVELNVLEPCSLCHAAEL